MKCLSGTNDIWLYPSGDHKYYLFLGKVIQVNQLDATMIY